MQKHGKSKLRKQAHDNYISGTPEYRKEIDNISAVVWTIVIIVLIIIGVIVFSVSGMEGLLKSIK